MMAIGEVDLNNCPIASYHKLLHYVDPAVAYFPLQTRLHLRLHRSASVALRNWVGCATDSVY